MQFENIETELENRFKPILETLEIERKKIADNNFNVIIQGLGVVFFCSMIALGAEAPIFYVLGIAIALIMYFTLANIGLEEWLRNYKTEVVSTLIKSTLGETSVYEPTNGHKEFEFNASKLFDRTPDRYHSEDLIKGKVGKTFLYFSEVKAEYKTQSSSTDSDGNTTIRTNWHILFEGLLLTADFNKHFQKCTIVKESSFWDFFSSGNITLENTEFMKQFSVYTEDSLEARYILTPSFMERILVLNKKWGGQLGFSFSGSFLTIAIPSHKNFFELDLSAQPIHVTEYWKRDWHFLLDLISIVEDLDLNTRIWTKE